MATASRPTSRALLVTWALVLVVGAALTLHGQVKITPGFGTVPVGSSGSVMKPSGLILKNLAGITDASVQNQWNTFFVTLPATALATTGDTIDIEVDLMLAANANTKEAQLWFGGTTCSGTGANLCAGGCKLNSNTISTTGNATAVRMLYTVIRSGSSTQLRGGVAFQGANTMTTDNGTCAITDTAAADIYFGIRNITAAAASVQSSAYMRVNYSGQ